MKWAFRLVMVALLVASGPSTARAARTAGAEHERGIATSIDAADLPETRAELPVHVKAELARLIAAQGELPPGVFVAEDREVLIELRPGPIPGDDDVLIHAILRLDGELLAESSTEACLACSDEEVAQKALLLLEPLLPKLPAPAAPEPPPPTLPAAERSADAPRVPSPAPPRRQLLIPGATLLGAGAVGLGVGLGLIVANERVVSPADALELEVVKYREPGIALAVVGGAAVITGAALLIAAFRKRG